MNSRPIARREMVAAGLLLLVALALRAWGFEHTGIEHYDEGVYAVNAHAIGAGGAMFPNFERFAPPVYYGVAGALVRLGAAADRAGIAINIALGTLTVALVWAAGRSWFGPVQGIVAAALVATSGLHLMLSRVMLTDMTFAFCFLGALVLAVRAMERESWRLAVAAGVATGIAWNTKYHGWFVVVVLALAMLPVLHRMRDDRTVRRQVGLIAVIGVVAGLCFVPWALVMAGEGASAGGTFAYYASLIGAGWVRNATIHVAQLRLLEHPVTQAGIPLALAAASHVMLPGRAAGWATLVGASGIAVMLGQVGMVVIAAAVGAWALWPARMQLPVRVLGAWIVLWVLSAPLYEPYARLILPLVIALALLAGVGLAWVAERGAGHAPILRPAALAAIVAVVVVSGTTDRTVAQPWKPSRGLARAASWIEGRVAADEPVLVAGEPSLAAYLVEAGVPRVTMSSDLTELDTMTSSALVVRARYARRLADYRARFQAASPRAELLGMQPFRPTDLRILDDLSPHRVRPYRANPDGAFDLEIHRVRPARGGTVAQAAR